MLREGVDPKTAPELGSSDSVTLFLETYARAMKKAQLTETLFGTAEETQKTKSVYRRKDPPGGTTGRVSHMGAGVDGRSRLIQPQGVLVSHISFVVEPP
jgi:hypothetical protein